MKSRKHDLKATERKKPRFMIERLEQRIAPKKGGIPGPPDHSNGGPKCHPHKDGGSELC